MYIFKFCISLNTTIQSLSSHAKRSEDSMMSPSIFSLHAIEGNSPAYVTHIFSSQAHCPYQTLASKTARVKAFLSQVTAALSFLTRSPLCPLPISPFTGISLAPQCGVWADLHGWLYRHIMKPLQLATQTQYHNVGQLVCSNAKAKLTQEETTDINLPGQNSTQ